MHGAGLDSSYSSCIVVPPNSAHCSITAQDSLLDCCGGNGKFHDINFIVWNSDGHSSKSDVAAAALVSTEMEPTDN